MCGINGALRLVPDAPPLEARELCLVRDAMAARGPDGEGLWLSPDGLAGFGHRRLSIVDLSPAGAQPMSTEDGRFTLVFNGEIYNHRELRAELEREGARLRSKSDSEVLLRLFARDGVELFARLEGMYAFAAWDALRARLVLARDPFGIKPLYYHSDGRVLRFASQVRALERVPGLLRERDPAGLCGFLLWGSVPEPFTLWRALRALPAGHWLEAGPGHVGEPRRHAPRPTRRRERTAQEALAGAARAVERSLRLHLVADVPVGVFLSAGLDSALLAALARRALPEPPQSFTLTFDEFRGGALDEGPGAAAVAASLGLRHHERRIPREALEELWPRALEAMDQPSIDGFNVFVVSHYAREAGMKVALSGLGGDELFGGYPSFADVPRWARLARLGRALPGLSAAWPWVARALGTARRPKLRGLVRHAATLAGAYFVRRGLYLPEELPDLVGADVAAEGLQAYDPVEDAQRHLRDGGSHLDDALDGWSAVQRLETGQYLRNQLLRDADWASMAHGLEIRVPFVLASLVAELHAHGFAPQAQGGKAALARVLAPELPEAALRRGKSGFTIPATRDVDARVSWGLQARRRALRILSRRFGIDVRPPRGARGGTLFLLPEAFQRPGGIQRYNRDQVQALRRCRADEPLTALVLNDAADDVRRPEWRHVRALGAGRRKPRFALCALRHALTQRPARVILGHRNFLPLAPALWLVAPRAERWLLSYGVEVEAPFRLRERLALRCVTRAFAISPYTASRVRAAGCRLPAELWPCALPFDFALPSVEPPRFEPPLRLLTVSRLAPPERYKGIDDTLRALALLARAGLAARLDVVGDGEDAPRLRDLARAEGVAERVTFHGRLDDARVRALYAAADVFVLPSRAEGFGIVYLEALAHARPVVAADAAGAPFVVRPGESGYLVPYGDPEALAACLARLLAHPDEARGVGASGRRLLERSFTFEALVERTRALLAGRGA